MKKLISILLLMTFLLSSIPFAVGAADTDGVISSHGKLPFEDIDETSWYIPGLIYCYSNEIISGAGNTYTFNPKGELTRATFAVMLARAIKADTSVAGWDSFDDCDNSDTCWYIDAVEWAFFNEYMNGTGERRFSPNMTMTREQLATVFMRFMERENYAVTVDDSILDDYTDADKISAWAVEGVKYAICAGLISSTATSHKAVSPQMPVTREQAVKLFMSFLSLYFYADCEHDFSEATCTTSSVCSKCGVADGLPTGHLCDTLSCKVGGTCKRCGEAVEADAGLHNYPTKATCTEPEKCTVCGNVRTHAYGHNYAPATCIKLATCYRCGATAGGYRGHTMSGGKCTVCGYCPYDVIYKYATVTNPDNGRYWTSDNESFSMGIMYWEDVKSLSLIGVHAFNNTGHSDYIAFLLPKNSTTIDFMYEYYNADGELLFYGEGTFDAGNFNANANISFSYYEGNASDVNTAIGNVKNLGDDMLKMGNEILSDAGLDVRLNDIGFHYYQ
ncbi:MAG: S-layer homology domain-containing protein [Clostridia bacterium]|nr:S-layer homology domain-containing protein [Clostridia bacterium]